MSSSRNRKNVFVVVVMMILNHTDTSLRRKTSLKMTKTQKLNQPYYEIVKVHRITSSMADIHTQKTPYTRN
jgi:hypothetical protein